MVVKLGSTLVADDRGELRGDVLSEVCRQVAEIERDGNEVVLVTSGAIAQGMRTLGMSARPEAMEELQAASAVGQGPLYDVYAGLLSGHGIKTAQVLLTFFDISARAQYINARQTLGKLAEWNIVPIVNENDTTSTDEIGFGDNDALAAQVSVLLGANLLVILSDVDALFDKDPNSHSDAQPVAEVSDLAELSGYEIGTSSSHIGSGGMRSKVLAAEMASSAGIAVVICNGAREGTLLRAVTGEPEGTRFHPQERTESSFKLWLRYAKASSGTIYVDEGAERALRDQGRSLLPVGVVDIDGSFQPGDAVDVARRGDGGGPIGKGITNYSADELRSVKGKKSAEVRDLLPRAVDEAVHRDYFVLL
ncbi:MAG: glutamate 5-kinase [Solirubrobacterales bacterium]